MRNLVLMAMVGCGATPSEVPAPPPAPTPDLEALYASWPTKATDSALTEAATEVTRLRRAWAAATDAPEGWTGEVADTEIALLRWAQVHRLNSQLLTSDSAAAARAVINEGALADLPSESSVTVDLAGGITFATPKGEVDTKWVVSAISALVVENTRLGFEESVFDIDGASAEDAEGWFLALESMTKESEHCRFSWNPESEGRVLGDDFGDLNEIEVRAIR